MFFRKLAIIFFAIVIPGGFIMAGILYLCSKFGYKPNTLILCAKKALAWPLAWSCYIMGDITSRLLEATGSVLGVIYQRTMGWSCALQDWAKLNGPWASPSDKNETNDR